jgi:hypothetical protein
MNQMDGVLSSVFEEKNPIAKEVCCLPKSRVPNVGEWNADGG